MELDQENEEKQGSDYDDELARLRKENAELKDKIIRM